MPTIPDHARRVARAPGAGGARARDRSGAPPRDVASRSRRERRGRLRHRSRRRRAHSTAPRGAPLRAPLRRDRRARPHTRDAARGTLPSVAPRTPSTAPRTAATRSTPRTHYAVVALAPPYALLALSPVTGRTHQIRVHASHAGAPLLGDRAYGGPARATLPSGRVLAFDRIALHAARVTLDGTVIESPVPEKLRALWLALGGDGAAWEKACAWPLDEK